MSRRTTGRPPVLPGFTYIRPLGSGGFADVFAYDQQLPARRVAVKIAEKAKDMTSKFPNIVVQNT